MDVSPLSQVVNTVTLWHLVAWATFVALCIAGKRNNSQEVIPLPLRLACGIVIPPSLYAMMAVIVVQAGSPPFPLGQLLQSGLLAGALTSSIFLVFGLWVSVVERQALPIVVGAVGFALGTGLFGLFFAGIWWLFPRVLGIWFH